MGTFVLVFEYLDVNVPPYIWVVKSLYNSSYTCISVTYNGMHERFMDAYIKVKIKSVFLKKQNKLWLEMGLITLFLIVIVTGKINTNTYYILNKKNVLSEGLYIQSCLFHGNGASIVFLFGHILIPQ